MSADTKAAIEAGEEFNGALLASAREACRLCGKSLRTWRMWDAAGWIPRPLRIGRSALWRVDELRAWVTAGCPRRVVWEQMKEAR